MVSAAPDPNPITMRAAKKPLYVLSKQSHMAQACEDVISCNGSSADAVGVVPSR
jgi:hypothetical protein